MKHQITIITVEGQNHQLIEVRTKRGALPARNRRAFAYDAWHKSITRIDFTGNGILVDISIDPALHGQDSKDVLSRVARALIRHRKPGTIVSHIHFEPAEERPEETDVGGLVVLSFVNDGTKFVEQKN